MLNLDLKCIRRSPRHIAMYKTLLTATIQPRLNCPSDKNWVNSDVNRNSVIIDIKQTTGFVTSSISEVYQTLDSHWSIF